MLPFASFGQSALTVCIDSFYSAYIINYAHPTPTQMATTLALATKQCVAIGAYAGSLGGGTVTSVTPGIGFTSHTPITTAGTMNIDTANTISTKLWSIHVLDSGLYAYSLPFADTINLFMKSDSNQYKGAVTLSYLQAHSGNTYSAGYGLNLSGTTFNVDSSKIAIWGDTVSGHRFLCTPTYISSLGYGSGTVTSVNSGWGTNFTNFTTTGSVIVDSSAVTTFGTVRRIADSAVAPKYNTADTQYLVRKIDSNILGHYVTPTALADSCDTLRQLVYSNMSGYVNYYLDSTHIGNYRTLIPIYSYTTQTISYSSVTNGMILDSFITQSGVPDQATLRSGIYNVHLHATQTSGTKVSALYFQVYTIDTTGHSTLRFTTANTNVLSGSDAGYDANGIISSDIVISNKDRYMIKVLASVTGGGSAPTIQLAMKNNSISSLQAPSAGASVGKYVPYTGGVNSLDLTGHNGKFDTVNAKVSLSNIYPSPTTGTVTSVATSTGIIGGTITTTGTLQIDSTIVPKWDDTLSGNRWLVTPTYLSSKGYGTGTVTSISAGYGTTFTTITTSGSVTVDTTAISTKANVTAAIGNVIDTIPLSFTLNGQGTVINLTQDTIVRTVPYRCKILAWQVVSNLTGSCQYDITVSGTSLIGGSGNYPLLSSARTNNSAVTSWATTLLTQGQVLYLYLTSVTGITYVQLNLLVQKL